MFSYTMTQWVALFLFYCFFGWCFESIYVSIRSKKLINRGFMRGPFLPLYGTGAIMMILVSKPFTTNIFFMFIAGCIGATVLELVTGVLMESIFKVRYWDYSNERLNYKGHICLQVSLVWGLLTILMTEVINKPVENLLSEIPSSVLTFVTTMLSIILIIDFFFSFVAALDIAEILIRMERAKISAKEEMEIMRKRLDVYVAVADDVKEDLLDEIENRVHKYKKEILASTKGFREFYRRAMIKGNPTMISRKFKDSLEEIKEHINEKIGK